MSLPGGDNPQSLTLTLCPPDHSQLVGLHVYLNMIRVLAISFYFISRTQMRESSSYPLHAKRMASLIIFPNPIL